MRSSKSILLILIFSIVLSLVACKKKEEDNSYKIAFITDSEEINSYTRSGKIAKVLNTLAENRKNIKVSTKISDSDDNYIDNIKRYVKNKYNLIVLNSYTMKKDVEIIAPLNENIKFLIFDSVIDPKLNNIISISYKVNESSFLAGYLAALETKTNILGYIGFESGTLSDMYEFGFRAGVYEAAKELNKSINIHIKRVNDLSDFKNGKKLADEMYKNDVDIIYQTVGLTGLGVIESAKKNNKLVIGYDVEQKDLAPENVLFSTLKNYEKTAAATLSSYIDGANAEGQNLFLGVKEDAVDISTYNEKSKYSEENYKKMQSKKNQILSGEITVPLDKDSYEKFINK